MHNLETGMKLRIRPKGDTAAAHELITHIESVMPDDHILLTTPIHKGMVYPYAPDDTLHLSFPAQNGVCHFKCAVAERFTQGNIDYIKARITSEVTHKQRREMFRVKTDIEGEISAERQSDGETVRIQSTCRASDISGGGMGLFTKAAFEVGENVTVSVPIGENGKTQHLYSEVRWHRPIDGTVYTSHIGVQFCLYDNIVKETVMKYVFQLQQKILREKRGRR